MPLISTSILPIFTLWPEISDWKGLEKWKRLRESLIVMMARREGSLMRNNSMQSLRNSTLVIAVAIGVAIGCVFAFLFPNRLFVSNAIPIANRGLEVYKTQQVRYFEELMLSLFLFSFWTFWFSDSEIWWSLKSELIFFELVLWSWSEIH